MNPAEDQRERQSERQHAAPGKARVHDPALGAASRDELLKYEVVQEKLPECSSVSCPAPPPEKNLQTAPQIHPRWRPLRPNRIPVDDCKRSEDTAHGVRCQCPV